MRNLAIYPITVEEMIAAVDRAADEEFARIKGLEDYAVVFIQAVALKAAAKMIRDTQSVQPDNPLEGDGK